MPGLNPGHCCEGRELDATDGQNTAPAVLHRAQSPPAHSDSRQGSGKGYPSGCRDMAFKGQGQGGVWQAGKARSEESKDT